MKKVNVALGAGFEMDPEFGAGGLALVPQKYLP